MKDTSSIVDYEIFFSAWEKHLRGEKLDSLETQIRKIIEMHPQVHELIEATLSSSANLTDIDTEAFMHLAFHSILIEMISSDQPPGVRRLYDQLVVKAGDKHEAQHRMMTIIFDWLVQEEVFDLKQIDGEKLLSSMRLALDVQPDSAPHRT